RSPICADQDARHHRLHPTADLDTGWNVFVSPESEPDVYEALAAHLRPLLTGDNNVRRPWDQPGSDCECPERPTPRSRGRVLVDSEHARREHPAVQAALACGGE